MLYGGYLSRRHDVLIVDRKQALADKVSHVELEIIEVLRNLEHLKGMCSSFPSRRFPFWGPIPARCAPMRSKESSSLTYNIRTIINTVYLQKSGREGRLSLYEASKHNGCDKCDAYAQ